MPCSRQAIAVIPFCNWLYFRHWLLCDSRVLFTGRYAPLLLSLRMPAARYRERASPPDFPDSLQSHPVASSRIQSHPVASSHIRSRPPHHFVALVAQHYTKYTSRSYITGFPPTVVTTIPTLFFTTSLLL
jgi:hypothetical protein